MGPRGMRTAKHGPNAEPGSRVTGADRIRGAVTRGKKEKLTALLHHITVDVLRQAFFNLKKGAAPGVDGVTYGKQRPLGIAAIEDKIVQAAVVAILTPIYEAEFLGFSYGFRPGRSQHDALDALAYGIKARKINWILDADISRFFDSLSPKLARKICRMPNWRPTDHSPDPENG